MKKPGNRAKAQNGRKQKWEEFVVGEEFMSNKEFENLISVEVLDDYNLVRSTEKESDVSKDSETSGRKRKLAEKKKKNAKSIKLDQETGANSDDEAEEIQNPGSQSPWLAEETTDDGQASEEEIGEDTSGARAVGSSQWIVTDMGGSTVPGNEDQQTKASQRKKAKKGKLAKTAPRKSNTQDVIEDDDDEGDETINYAVTLGSWSKLGVPTPVLKALHEKAFLEPTPIQRLTLPSSVLGKKDIVGAAETGSGKTLAFAIPIISGILKDREVKRDDDEEENAGSLKALVITPTRELAAQVRNHIIEAAKYTDIKTVLVVGGLAQQKQERLLRKRPEIVIATPGRLWELVQEGNQQLDLSQIKFLAIDETDRMVEKGHFQELEGILGTVNSDPACSGKRQNFIFSATLAFTHEPPQRLKKTSLKVSRNKQQAKKLSSKEKLRQIMDMVGVRDDAKIVDITQKKGTCESLTEMQILCQLAQKDYYLYYFFLRHPGRTIVFCNSINCVRRLANLFLLLNFEALPLHSDMHQKQRMRNLESFTANENGILIATDVAARGLDIVDVQHVIHYQVPRTAESYIHRSGRTARALKGGIAILFVEPAEVTQMKNIMRSLKRDEDPAPFDVDSKIFREVKERVDMAVKVEKFDHQVRKKSADMNWMDKARKEMDLASSDEGSDYNDDDDYGGGRKGERKTIEKAKRELDVNKQKLADMLGVNLFLNRPRGDVRTTFKKLAAIKTKAI